MTDIFFGFFQHFNANPSGISDDSEPLFLNHNLIYFRFRWISYLVWDGIHFYIKVEVEGLDDVHKEELKGFFILVRFGFISTNEGVEIRDPVERRFVILLSFELLGEFFPVFIQRFNRAFARFE